MDKTLEVRIPVNPVQIEKMDKMAAQVTAADIKVVSFSLMGTLVSPLYSEDHDIFLLMESEFPDIRTSRKTFSELRIDAEIEAKSKNNSKYDVSLKRIYEILRKKAKLSEEVCNKLFQRECEIFKELIIPRNFGKKLFTAAVGAGKKTIISAETCYPRDVIVAVLVNSGYEVCSELIVSNELNIGEKRGERLFSEILKKSGVLPEKLIHVGGNVETDVELPITKGARALLLSDPRTIMEKSGNLRGYAEAERIYDYSTINYLSFHMAMGIYSAYIFDISRNKTVRSDFCGNPYILGFIVYGTYLLMDRSKLNDEEKIIISALEKNKEIVRGGEEFSELFRSHFGTYFRHFSFEGFDLPLKFIAFHCDSADVGIIKKYLTAEEYKSWTANITEPTVVRKSRRDVEQNGLEKLADKMFPPGTRVRNITDGIITKLKGKSRF